MKKLAEALIAVDLQDDFCVAWSARDGRRIVNCWNAIGKLLPVIAWCAICLSSEGCLSAALVTQPLLSIKNPRKEMAFQQPPARGHYVGPTLYDGKEFSLFQFPNVLLGAPPRILEILIPPSQYNAAIIRETSAEGVPSHGDIPISNWEKGCDETLDVNTSMYVRLTDLSPALYTCTRERRSDPFTLQFYIPESHLRWKRRSRSQYAIGHLGYLLTLPIDIITYPFQYWFWKSLGEHTKKGL